MSRSNHQFELSPGQQDLLVAALNSNAQDRTNSPQQTSAQNNFSNGLYDSPVQQAPGSGQLAFGVDDSPYLEFDGEFDDTYNFDLADQQMIGDLPSNSSGENTERNDSADQDHDLHDKRKSIDGQDDDDQGDAKRREGEDKTAKKPGRKPLTSEPTTKRKAQNRAAQRAFRDRKEKHLKDLETKVDDLTKASESASHENGLLRAQVERLQVELKEYRKRLSWVSNSGLPRSSGFGNGQSNSASQSRPVNKANDFQFEFPKFGDLPAAPFGNNTTTVKSVDHGVPSRSTSLPDSKSKKFSPGFSPKGVTSSQVSTGGSPASKQLSPSASSQPTQRLPTNNAYDPFTGLFSPSTIEASRSFEYFPSATTHSNRDARGSSSSASGMTSQAPGLYTNSSASNTDSPSNSSDSQRAISSIGTSPEPSLNSPSGSKLNDLGLNTINEEMQYPQGSSFGSNMPSTGNDWNWLVHQNGGNFDPVLFGDYRDPQDAVINQDFGSFFNEAFPLPDLGSPLHNFNEVISPGSVPPKVDLMKQVEAAQNGDGPVDKNEDGQAKMMSCNKIWDRLQSMEKFRNGEIDVDNLCSELRAKARCSEGGAVVDTKDVDKILGLSTRV